MLLLSITLTSCTTTKNLSSPSVSNNWDRVKSHPEFNKASATTPDLMVFIGKIMVDQDAAYADLKNQFNEVIAK